MMIPQNAFHSHYCQLGNQEDWDELLSRRTHRDTKASSYSGTISHAKFSLAFHSILSKTVRQYLGGRPGHES